MLSSHHNEFLIVYICNWIIKCILSYLILFRINTDYRSTLPAFLHPSGNIMKRFLCFLSSSLHPIFGSFKIDQTHQFHHCKIFLSSTTNICECESETQPQTAYQEMQDQVRRAFHMLMALRVSVHAATARGREREGRGMVSGTLGEGRLGCK